MDFGKRLRSAREQRGVTLRQIALNTKISLGTLEALERNDPSRLPGGIFSRAFVRSYALEIGLDPERTVAEFLSAFPKYRAAPEVEVEATPASSDGRPLVGLATIAVVCALALGGYYGWPWWQQRQTEAAEATDTLPPPPVRVSAPPPEPPDAGTEPLSLVEGQGGGARETPLPGSAPGEEVRDVPHDAQDQVAAEQPAVEQATVSDQAGLRLSVHPREACWVRIVVGGQVRLARLMQAGEREELETQGAVFLEIGDAAAFDYSVNGSRGRSLGAVGQVVRATIRQDNLDDFIVR